MHEIKCPKCGTTFTIDEASYADILKQVHNTEFDSEISERIHLIEEKYKTELSSSEKSKAQAIEIAKRDIAENLNKKISEKDSEIAELRAKLNSIETEKRLAVTEATSKIERELDGYKKDLENARSQSASKELMIRQNYEQQLRDRDDMIERLKDLKARLSTKMVGETLEQHCQNEFNSIRATAFPFAKFGKDNEVSESGSKGDYIFRDFDEGGNEIVSIMFEMKNENDTTATKHKNEHFFKELDKDRREKKCEYAVLVSLLESDNELYNRGIVDVSYEYPKMYVIRPQFFLPLIGIIANTSRNALEYKSQLVALKNQNIDIVNFENNINAFKEGFARNYELASRKFKGAIDEIDKTIDHLKKVKDELLSSENNLRLANNKAEDLTIKRLTRGNATMSKMFDDLHKGEN